MLLVNMLGQFGALNSALAIRTFRIMGNQVVSFGLSRTVSLVITGTAKIAEVFGR